MKDVDIVNYADDNTSYITGDNIDQVMSALQNAAASLFKWFSDNQMKVGKRKLIAVNVMGNSKCKKLLG